jgi:hypothetical protein
MEDESVRFPGSERFQVPDNQTVFGFERDIER